MTPEQTEKCNFTNSFRPFSFVEGRQDLCDCSISTNEKEGSFEVQSSSIAPSSIIDTEMSVSLTDPMYFTEKVFLRIPIEIRIKDLTELEATVANQNASAVNTTITLNETAVDDFMPSE